MQKLPPSTAPPELEAIEPAAIELSGGQYGPRLVGAWTLAGIEGLEQRLEALAGRWPNGGKTRFGDELRFDAAGLVALDTSGALLLLGLLQRLRNSGRRARVVRLRKEYDALLKLVAERGLSEPTATVNKSGWLAQLGRRALQKLTQIQAFLAFIGEVSLALWQALRQPKRLRLKPLTGVLESAGVNALPIVALMAFLLGVVIAYQGGLQLRTYGANIFIVELVALTMLRELAPLIAAIMVAGRTGSAFTAQIGTMQVTEEIDALRTLGIDPLDMLVIPKLLALVIALPLLTVFADAFSIFGGMVMAQTLLGISFGEFLSRIPETVSVNSFLVGVGKAPVFAAIIALVGCYQGFQVSASAESVGRQTTISVVQAIFLVITADAAFSVVFGALGI